MLDAFSRGDFTGDDHLGETRTNIPPLIQFGTELRDLMAPYFVKPPACDPDRIWVIASEFTEGHKNPHYVWTTRRMMQNVHWWLQANNQVIDNVGKLFITFDGDHDVIRAKLHELQRNHRTVRMKFDSSENTPNINTDVGVPATSALLIANSASSSSIPTITETNS